MARKTVNFETVREIARAIPGVVESTAYGSPAIKMNGKLVACLAIHRSAEPGTLAVRVSFEDRAELLEAAPQTYYLTDHYVNYPSVLVRLSRIQTDGLRDLLRMAVRFVTAEGAKKRPPRRAR